MTPKQTRVLRLLLLGVLLGGLLLAGRRLGWTERLSLQRLRAMMVQAGVLGVPLYFLAFAVGRLIYVPGLALVAAGALVYGRVYGGVLSWLAALLAHTLVFVLTRRVGGQVLVEVKHVRLRWLLARLEQHPIIIVALLRPVFLLSPQLDTIVALSAISFRDYFIATALGLLPTVVGVVLCMDYLVGR